MRYFFSALIYIFMTAPVIADKDSFPNHLLGVWKGSVEGSTAHIIFLKNGVLISLNEGELEQFTYQVSDCTDHCKLRLYKEGETESGHTIIQFMEGDTMRMELTEESDIPPTEFSNFFLLKRDK